MAKILIAPTNWTGAAVVVVVVDIMVTCVVGACVVGVVVDGVVVSVVVATDSDPLIDSKGSYSAEVVNFGKRNLKICDEP